MSELADWERELLAAVSPNPAPFPFSFVYVPNSTNPHVDHMVEFVHETWRYDAIVEQFAKKDYAEFLFDGMTLDGQRMFVVRYYTDRIHVMVDDERQMKW